MAARNGERFFPQSKYRGQLIFAEDFTIKNISDSGICVETSQRILTNNTYRIQLLSDDNSGDNKKIILQAEVVWSVLKGSRKEEDNTFPLYEVGLRFLELNDGEKQFIGELITSIANKS